MPRRAALSLGGAAILCGCVSEMAPTGPRVLPVTQDGDAFVMSDGARLPYRAWLPAGPPRAVVLALHGINDSRDGWELPAPDFARAGIAFYAADQRGFGAAPGRGFWPGADSLADDASEMAALLGQRHPGARLVLMGESMGGAVLMYLATRSPPPEVSGYILLAPAVWGRARMNLFLRAGLWLGATLTPGMTASRPPPGIRVIPSDNMEALVRLSRNPLTVHATRFDTVRGLVDLMDLALAAAPRFTAPALFQYGAHDDLVPKEATRTIWTALPPSARRAFYPDGYHLLMRDLDRSVPIGDAIAWINDPASPLPSGADAAAAAWIAAGA